MMYLNTPLQFPGYVKQEKVGEDAGEGLHSATTASVIQPRMGQHYLPSLMAPDSPGCGADSQGNRGRETQYWSPWSTVDRRHTEEAEEETAAQRWDLATVTTPPSQTPTITRQESVIKVGFDMSMQEYFLQSNYIFSWQERPVIMKIPKRMSMFLIPT